MRQKIKLGDRVYVRFGQHQKIKDCLHGEVIRFGSDYIWIRLDSGEELHYPDRLVYAARERPWKE